MWRIMIAALLVAILAGCGSSSGAPPTLTLSSYPPDPHTDQPFLDLVHAAQLPGDPQKLISIGHAVCTSLKSTNDYTVTTNEVMAYGYTQRQASILTGLASGAYCPDVKASNGNLPIPTS